MARRQDIPKAVLDLLVELRLVMQEGGDHPVDTKKTWYHKAKESHGPRTAQVVLMLFEAGVPLSQINNAFYGETTMTQENVSGGQNIKQTAGGDMTGVNAGGTQTIRDITIYKQDLDQTGAVIAAPLKQALVEAREGLQKSDIDPAIRPLLIEQFDKLTEELKKGDKKNSSLIKTFWSMLYGAIQTLPDPGVCYTAFEKLKVILGV